MGNIQEKFLPHPFAPLLKSLGVAGRAKSSGAAGEHQEAFLPTVGTADAGKSATGVTTVEIALDDFFDDRAQEAILLLEAALILRQEAVEVMEEHPIKDSPLRMSGAIN
ncbi:MAG: hypothetical protein QME85_11840 [Candidatus Saccharicenans sp.]|nr:hypothetical protein [Candidatus Saccharicenans sp.]